MVIVIVIGIFVRIIGVMVVVVIGMIIVNVIDVCPFKADYTTN